MNKLDYYEIGKRIRKCHLKPLFLFVRPFLSAQITCCVTSCLKTLLFFSSLCPKPRNTADSSTKNIPASSRPLLTLLIVSENPPGKKALEIKDFFITKYRFFQNRTLSYRPISIFFSCCCISRLTPATGAHIRILPIPPWRPYSFLCCLFQSCLHWRNPDYGISLIFYSAHTPE